MRELRSEYAAWCFILIWSSGFIIARSIAGHADPHLFLLARFLLVIMLFTGYSIATRALWPDRAMAWRLAGTGALLQGLYLGPGFWAVAEGLQPAVMSLFGSLQPPLTALIAWRLLGEQPTRWTLIGLLLGISGVALTVLPLLVEEQSAVGPMVVLAAVISILSITAGTLLQRSSVSQVALAPASAVQTIGAVVVVACLAFVLDEQRLPFDLRTLSTLAYAVLVLSVGGFTLLIWLVRHGSAIRVSSLLFMAPPLAALMAWLFFDDGLSKIQLAGFAVALTGVLLARR